MQILETNIVHTDGHGTESIGLYSNHIRPAHFPGEFDTFGVWMGFGVETDVVEKVVAPASIT